MNTIIIAESAFNPFNSRMPLIAACVAVELEGYDVWKFGTPCKSHYRAAHRFTRLIERGYNPEMAYKLAVTDGICPTLKHFEHYFEASIHDRLTDVTPPFIPVDYSVATFSIYSLSLAELDWMYKGWLHDGEEHLLAFAEDFILDYDELVAYCRGRAQREDEQNWNGRTYRNAVQY